MKGFFGLVGKFLLGATVVVAGLFAFLWVILGITWVAENVISEGWQATIGVIFNWVVAIICILLLAAFSVMVGDGIVEKIQERREHKRVVREYYENRAAE